ncbi:MAG: hypothetical protein RJA76_723 [Bacteroidota bacterium]|jgi:uncharacterized membrane protein YiaA
MSNFPLDKKRIQVLLIGIAIIFLGLFVMTLDKSEFGMGFTGITLGPILVLLGVIIPIFSLFKIKK